jgi:hypothetical protein
VSNSREETKHFINRNHKKRNVGCICFREMDELGNEEVHRITRNTGVAQFL